MGMLEDMNVNICGIPLVHTFAVVDFTQETNYDVILGQPFMRQMLVVQDWGYNRLYLRYQNSIVKVNLDDHTYRDVTRTPIEDFESSLVQTKDKWESKDPSAPRAQMCDLFERALMLEEMEKTKALELDTSYVPKSFFKVEINEHAWMQVLATIDVSAMSKGTKFCGDMGQDTIPIRMVHVIPFCF